MELVVKVLNQATATMKKIGGDIDMMSEKMKAFNKASAQLKFVNKLEAAGIQMTANNRLRDRATNLFVSMEQAVQKIARAEAAANLVTAKKNALLKKQKKLQDAIKKSAQKVQKAAAAQAQKQMQKMKSMQKTMLAVGLAFLFAGMAVKKLFESALREGGVV